MPEEDGSENEENDSEDEKAENDDNSVNNFSSKKNRLEPNEDSDDDLKDDCERNRVSKRLKNQYKNIKNAKSSNSENFFDQPMVFEKHSVTKKELKDVNNCRKKENAPKKSVSFLETPSFVIPIISYADELDTEVEDESTYNNTESEDLSKKVDESMAFGKNDKDSNTEATEKLNTKPSENTMKTEMVESKVEATFAYNVCEYVPPKRVKKKEFSHRGTNDPETGCLPVDQKVLTQCYSQNGTKVEKEALKEKAETNNTKSQEKKSEDEKKVEENAKEEQVAKSLTAEKNLVDPISNIQNHCVVKTVLIIRKI